MIPGLEYAFFQNALLAGILASIACGIIGSYVVVRRMVSMSGGISHAAFGGIGLGYYLGVDPILGALGFTVVTALAIGVLQMRAREQLDTLIGAVWAAGMAIGILLVYLTPGFAPDLFSYLFGNILLVPRSSLYLMAVLVIFIIMFVGLFYTPLLAITFDEEYAEIMNLPVERLSLLLLTLIAFTVVMLIQVVGIILVIALLTLPAAISRMCTARLGPMMLLAIGLGALFCTGGILLSSFLDVPSGATIILFATAVYASFLVGRYLRTWQLPGKNHS
ncbi:MAG: metal ABC transporter permease [Methanomicrobiaceae archaeon]|nr:metal ABC transporter permease [Methanomicrobiaceae archaeon]